MKSPLLDQADSGEKISRSFLPVSPPPHLQELGPGIDDVSPDPLVDPWARGPLGAGYWQFIIGGHNAFSPDSQALIVIQVPWSSGGRRCRRAVLSYVSWPG